MSIDIEQIANKWREEGGDIAEIAFLAGYQTAQPKWISVDKRLPEGNGDVLAYTVHNSFQETKVVRYEPSYGFDYQGIVICWMPLPEPPKESQQ